MMTWVDHPSYFGPDRRRAKSFRLLERRRRSHLQEPPTMAAGLRRLKLHMLEAVGPDNLAAFATEVAAIAALGKLRGRPDIAMLLQELHRNLTAEGAGDIDQRVLIDFALASCDERLVHRAPRLSDGAFPNALHGPGPARTR